MPSTSGLVIIGGMRAGAFAQHVFQGDRSAVLLEKIAEGFIRQVLEVDHAVLGQAVDGVPDFGVKGDAFANSSSVAAHQAALLLLRLVEALLRDDFECARFLLEVEDAAAE